jgi:hypothetical protein
MGDYSLMNMLNEIKRIVTKDFWKRVLYWSALKWSRNKNQPISPEDWFPIVTCALLGILLGILYFIVLKK